MVDFVVINDIGFDFCDKPKILFNVNLGYD